MTGARPLHGWPPWAFLHAASTAGAVAVHADPLSRNGGLTGKPFSLGEVTTMTATLRQRAAPRGQ